MQKKVENLERELEAQKAQLAQQGDHCASSEGAFSTLTIEEIKSQFHSQIAALQKLFECHGYAARPLVR